MFIYIYIYIFIYICIDRPCTIAHICIRMHVFCTHITAAVCSRRSHPNKSFTDLQHRYTPSCTMALPQSKPLQLAELNQRSAPFASFDIVIHHSRIEDYEYSTKTGEKKNGASFRCLLVSKDNSDQYLVAECPMRGTNRAPIMQLLDKFKTGLIFRMTKTRLKGGIKQEYIHAPIKIVVDMAGTKFDPLLSSGDGQHLAPQPVMSIAQGKSLRTTQRFDITALICAMSDTRTAGHGREVFDVTILDGSKSADDQKLVQLKLNISRKPLQAQHSSTTSS